MAILLTCTSCSAKMNAPDHLAGKKAKCPKCGEATPVPANASTAVTTTPSKRDKPAASTAVAIKPKSKIKAADPDARPKKKAPALPLKSFEELKVGGRFRALIEKEIGNEEIVWMGRPDIKARMKKAWLGSIIGAVFTLLSPLSFLVLLADAKPDQEWIKWAIAGGIFTVLLVLFCLPMLFMPLLVRIFINYRPVYVLMESRALVAENRFGISAKFHTFDRTKLLKDMEVKVEDDGMGSIIMGYEVVTMEGAMRHRTKTATSEDGSRKTTTSTLDRAVGTDLVIPLGFLDVHDILAVEALVRRTLNLPAKSAS